MRRLLWVLPAAALLLGSCQRQIEKLPRVICPGRASVEEAVAALRQRQANFHPVRAAADATMEWIDEKGKRRTEGLDARLFFVPTDRLYLSGNKLGTGDVQLGTNPEDFWLVIEPEIDSYWWGDRQTGRQCAEVLPFDPETVIEALGVVNLDAEWVLTNEDGYDILTRLGPLGLPQKRIWIDACDYLVERIEIYPSDVEIVRILLDAYETTDTGYNVPTDIRIEQYRGTDVIGAMRLELNGIRLFEPTERQMQRLFVRPAAERFENVYVLTEDCEFVEVNEE